METSYSQRVDGHKMQQHTYPLIIRNQAQSHPSLQT